MYLKLRDSRVSRGDMYEFMSDIETHLHALVKSVLEREYGEQWWRLGIPLPLRQACASRREEDEMEDDDRFSYTTFVDLEKILNKQWRLFEPELPKDRGKDKRKLLHDLVRLNSIRSRSSKKYSS